MSCQVLTKESSKPREARRLRRFPSVNRSGRAIADLRLLNVRSLGTVSLTCSSLWSSRSTMSASLPFTHVRIRLHERAMRISKTRRDMRDDNQSRGGLRRTGPVSRLYPDLSLYRSNALHCMFRVETTNSRVESAVRRSLPDGTSEYE